MSNRNEVSALVALRELRDMERLRLAEAEQARAEVEKERRGREDARRRAEEQESARHEVERRAAEAREAAESTRLRRDLDRARCEIAELLAQLERKDRARGDSALPPVRAPASGQVRARWFGWLGLSAGASMLVGALALTAAMRPPPPRTGSPEMSSLGCPDHRLAIAAEPRPVAAVVPETAAPPPAKVPRPRPSPSHPRGAGKPPASGPICDGTDPLCGLPLDTIDDLGKKRRKQQH